MTFMKWKKDGGYESTVQGLFLIEIKRLFSIVLLRFDEGSREAFHSHAFNCISWVLSGGLFEKFFGNGGGLLHFPSFKPVVTRRETFHKVLGLAKRNWVLTFRGPWAKTWNEFIPATGAHKTLTHGRVEV